MADTRGKVLLVGSVPRESAEEVFKICAKELGSYLMALPDGEPGDRKSWIQCQAKLVFDGHPAIETVRRPNTPDGLARDYRDNWSFRLKSAASRPEFNDPGYARWARESYEVFARLRRQGEIPADVRFQVSIPTPLGACATYFEDSRDREAVYRAYAPALLREVVEICHSIPAEDLAIQWDVCIEILEIAANISFLPDDPWQRAATEFPKLAAVVPDNAMLGYHLCYGDLGHRHFVEPQDLSLCVRMANLATTQSQRRVDWIHMPVPINRNDGAYFAPLQNLTRSDAQMFLGLIHLGDGVPGSLARGATARRYLQQFGIATECGLGRRQPETLMQVLAIHREVADRLALSA